MLFTGASTPAEPSVDSQPNRIGNIETSILINGSKKRIIWDSNIVRSSPCELGEVMDFMLKILCS